MSLHPQARAHAAQFRSQDHMLALTQLRHGWAVVAVLVLALSAWHGPALARAMERLQLTEAQAKAGFLYNCAMFVDWPAAAVPKNELVIGVLGDPVVADLVSNMHGRTVNGRRIVAASVQSGDDLSKLHILFVAGRNLAALRGTLERVGGAPVLTVGEHHAFTAEGGVVRLFTDQGRLRFEINMTRAENAGLRVSAKMLGLARIVR